MVFLLLAFMWKPTSPRSRTMLPITAQDVHGTRQILFNLQLEKLQWNATQKIRIPGCKLEYLDNFPSTKVL